MTEEQRARESTLKLLGVPPGIAKQLAEANVHVSVLHQGDLGESGNEGVDPPLVSQDHAEDCECLLCVTKRMVTDPADKKGLEIAFEGLVATAKVGKVDGKTRLFSPEGLITCMIMIRAGVFMAMKGINKDLA